MTYTSNLSYLQIKYKYFSHIQCAWLEYTRDLCSTFEIHKITNLMQQYEAYWSTGKKEIKWNLALFD